jgi:hypothetical protein
MNAKWSAFGNSAQKEPSVKQNEKRFEVVISMRAKVLEHATLPLLSFHPAPRPDSSSKQNQVKRAI